MFDYNDLIVNSILDFYEAEFYYSDTEFLPFSQTFWLKRYLAVELCSK